MNLFEAEQYILDRLKRELKPDLFYHGIHHTLDVANAAENLGQAEGLDTEDMALLRIAALYHDSGFIVTYSNHEEEGCRLAQAILPEFGLTSSQITRVCGMIMATKLPQRPQNLAEQILADADLDYLGRDDYGPIANNLYKEFLAYGIVRNEHEWAKLQVSFFESHSYFTKTARRMRNTGKQERLDQLMNALDKFDAPGV